MLKRKEVLGVVRDLLRQTRRKPGQTASKLELAASPEYWLGLNPQLSISSGPAGGRLERRFSGASRRNEALSRLREAGYFQIPDVFSPPIMEKMRAGIEALRREDWPPVFAFVYDEFWRIARGPFLSGFLNQALGPGYLALSNIWAHYVRQEASGWLPHVDGANERLGKISLWIPLSDATLDNGCMYVVPRSTATQELSSVWTDTRSITLRKASAFFQHGRALPAGAGSVLGWDAGIVHWGSYAQSSAPPRVSLALEFIRRDRIRKIPPGVLTINPQVPPPIFKERLEMIGRSLDDYSRFEPRMLRFSQVARKLAQTR